MPEYYGLSKEAVMTQLLTSIRGLKAETISTLQKEYGKNVLKDAKRKSRLSILLSQFTDV